MGLLWLLIAFAVLEKASRIMEEAIKERQKASQKYEAGLSGLLDYAEALGLGITREEIDDAFRSVDEDDA